MAKNTQNNDQQMREGQTPENNQQMNKQKGKKNNSAQDCCR